VANSTQFDTHRGRKMATHQSVCSTSLRRTIYSRRYTFQVIFIIESVLCVAFHIAGYLKAKKILQLSRSISFNHTKAKQKTGATDRAVCRPPRCQQHQRQPGEIEIKSINCHVTEAGASAAGRNMTQSRGDVVSDTRIITVHRSKEILAFLCTVPMYGDQCAHFAWLATYFKELIIRFTFSFTPLLAFGETKIFPCPFPVNSSKTRSTWKSCTPNELSLSRMHH
jgi:hypothetical protein